MGRIVPMIYKRSISKDLIVSLVFVVTLIIGGLIGLNYHYLSKENARNFNRQTDEYLSYLKETLAVPLWNYDHDSISKIAESLIRNDIIAGLRVTDSEMELVLFNKMGKGYQADVISMRKTEIWYEESHVGYVELYYSTTDFKKINEKIIWSSLVNLSVTLIILSFMTGLMLKLILGKPLHQLMMATDRIAKGEYDYEYSRELPRYTEIESILSKFNLMSDKIKERENALTTTTNRLSAILNNTTGLVYLKDTQGKYLFVNQRFEELFHVDSRKISELSDEDIFEDRLALLLTSHDKMVYNEDRPMEFEEVLPSKDEPRTYISIKFPLKDFMNKTYAICGISTDITQRKQAEEEVIRLNEGLEQRVQERTKEFLRANDKLKSEMAERQKASLALRANEALLRSTLESTADGILVVTKEGTITHFNERFCQIWQLTYLDFLNKDIEMIRPLMLRQIEEPDIYLEKIKSLYNETNEELGMITFRDGRIFERFSCPLINHGENLGRVWSYRDITSQQKGEIALAQAKEAAEAASQSKSMFLATMSHEIRTPMNGVMGMAGLLSSTHLDDEQKEYVNTIQSSAESLLTIINDILDFSKIEAGKLDLEVFDFDLYRVMDEVGDILAIKAHEKNLAFGCLIHHAVPQFLEGDPGRLRQILINLTSNAIKFTHDGEIGIRIYIEKELDDHVLLRFSITDTGIGITEKQRGRLFKPFSQVDASTTRQYGGTGLGLAISKRLASLMGGSIGVDSKEEEGATFWFTAKFKKQMGVDTLIPVSDEKLKGQRILTVDDNLINQEIILAYLSTWGCEAGNASDAAEGLKELHKAVNKNEPYDVIFIDRMMPDIDGEEFALAITANPKFKDIKMIMLTSSGLGGESKRAKEIGFHGYLTKPIKRDQLKRCVCLVLGLEEKGAQNQKNKVIITQDRLTESEGVRILLVEDNITNQKVAQHILKKFGYYSDVACNGKEAVTAFENIPYDMILMDVQMPVMDGMEASKRIRSIETYQKRENEKQKRIPIIALTANAMKGDRELCLSAGMDDYLSKPINPEELLEKMLQWGPRKRAVNPLAGASNSEKNGDKNGTGPEKAPLHMGDALGRSMGDTTFLKSIVGEFLDKKEEKLISFSTALEHSDLKTLEELAHSLKGVAANIGAYDLSQLAFKLQQLGEKDDQEGMTRIMEDLKTEFDRIEQFIADFDWSGLHS